MQPQAVNDLGQQSPLRRPCATSQTRLSWVEQAFLALPPSSRIDRSVDMAQSPLTAPNKMTYRQTQPSDAASAAASAASSAQSLAFTTWIFGDDSTHFDWQRAIEQSQSVLGQFGSEYNSQSNEFLVGDISNQSTARDDFDYTFPNGWSMLKSAPLVMDAVPSSVAGTRNSSPKSVTSNGLDCYYTPESMATPVQASPYTAGSMAIPIQESRMTPLNTVQPSADEDRYLAAAGLAALPLIGDKASLSGAQDNNEGTFQWYGVEPIQPPNNGDDENASAQLNGYTNVEVHPPVTRAPLTLAERKYNDKVLIEGKERGETYKQIRMKLIGECPAESTLRGRYRVLTKALNDRVRRPVWTKTDIILLTKIVNQEFERINTQVQNAATLSIRQKLSRVSWKTVADNIKANGGSYQFGVTTCKKKWIELNIPSSAPRALADADVDANMAALNQRL